MSSSQPLVMESASLVVKCPPHATVEEREEFIRERVNEAIHQRIKEIHEAPHVGQLKVEVATRKGDDLNTSVASADSEEGESDQPNPYNTAVLHI